MPDQLQLRGGTTSEHSSFTGAAREVTVDTTKKTLVVHDGSQAGGTPLMRESGSNAASTVQIGVGGSNKLTINSDGHIDIAGNLDVGAGIDVTGNITATGDADINGGDLTVTGGEGISAVLKLVADQGDDNGDGWRIISNQDDNDLTISNNVSGSYADKLTIKNNGDLHIHDKIIHVNDTDTAIRFPASNQFTVETGGVQRFKIAGRDCLIGNGGDTSTVGTPDHDVIVSSTTNNEEVAYTLNVMEGTNNRRAKIFLDDNDGIFGIDSTASTGVAPFVVRMAQSEKIRVDQAGNVGIGTSSPVRHLHISDSSSPRIMLSSDVVGNTSGNGTELILDTSGNFEILQRENLNIEFFTNNSQRMTILGDGKVGIGVTSPTKTLHVHTAGSGSSTIAVTNGDTGNSASDGFEFGVNSSEQAFFNNKESTDMLFFTGATERARIDSSGRILLQKGTANTTTSALQLGTGAGGYSWDVGNVPQVLISGINNEAPTNGQTKNIAFRIEDENINTMFQVYNNGGGNTDLGIVNIRGSALIGASSNVQNGRCEIRESGATNRALTIANTSASFTSTVFLMHAERETTNNTYQFIGCRIESPNPGVAAFRFEVHDNGDVRNVNNSYGQVSDISLKENIVDANSQWNDFKNLKFRSYNFKESTGFPTHKQIGLVAQEAETVCPHLIEEGKEDENTKEKYKFVKTSILYMKGMKALQEAMAKIEVLETKVAALEAA